MSSLSVADIPLTGCVMIKDSLTGKILHETFPGDPGDIMPGIAILQASAVYAEGNKTVIEVAHED